MPHRDSSVKMAADMLDFRRSRSDVLPAEIFGEPAWDVLLELYVAANEGRQLTGAILSERLKVHPSVLIRWIAHLFQIGLISGGRTLDQTLTLSDTAMAHVDRLIRRHQSTH